MRRDDLLDLNDVLQHPGRRLEVDIETELENEGDLDLVKPLVGFLEAYSTGNLLLITGEFSTTAVVECSRCLEPLEREVKFELDEQFPVEGTPSMLNTQDYARVVPEDEPFPLFEGNNLVVENLLRQTLILNMPLQPVCADGPEGECPPENLRALREHLSAEPVEAARRARVLDRLGGEVLAERTEVLRRALALGAVGAHGLE
ncbi:DUF177 domain-containing protein, partial [bacterium]